MKKRNLITTSLVAVWITGMLTALVSALPTTTQEIIDSMTTTLTPIFQALFGDYSSTEFLFVKILIFFMLITIITAVLKRAGPFKDNQAVVTVLAIAVPILSVRYLQDTEIIKSILLPYSTLGIAIMTALPFLIFFYFIHFSNTGSFGRRIFWIFFIVTFAVLWQSRYTQLGPIGNKIYGWTSLVIVLAFILDKEIHRYFKIWELNAFYKKANQKTIAALQAEYLNIVNVNTTDAKARRTEIENQLRNLGANLP